MFRLVSKGNFNKTNSMLNDAMSRSYLSKLNSYGERGVRALESATPKLSGETAGSWSYTISRRGGYTLISWENSAMAGETPLAVLLQYGHGTRQGGYVQGRDYINPAMQPIFDAIANEAWASLTRK